MIDVGVFTIGGIKFEYNRMEDPFLNIVGVVLII